MANCNQLTSLPCKGLSLVKCHGCVVHCVGTAVGKLLTLGGVGIWWIVDIILLVLGELRPADDSNWVPYY